MTMILYQIDNINKDIEIIKKKNQMELLAMKKKISEMKSQWMKFKTNWTLQKKNK